MKKQKAFELLEAQKAKLRNPGFTPDPWIDETSNYVAKIFGKESDQYRQTNEFVFKEEYPKTGGKYRVHQVGYPIYNDIELAEQFIEGLIEYINKLGLPKTKPDDPSNKKTKGGLSISNVWLSIIIPLIVVVIGGSFGLGYHFGSNKFDMEKEELYNMNQLMESELDNLRSSQIEDHTPLDSSIVE